MDLYAFHCKSFKQQVCIVLEQGKLIAVRSADRKRIELYYLKDFFAEFCYHSTTNKLVQIRGFKNVDLLDPYLEKITLPVVKS